MGDAAERTESPVITADKKAGRYDSAASMRLLSRQHSNSNWKKAMIAVELPVAVSFHGTTHAVMMASPDDLEDFAIGFSLTEGLIQAIEEIEKLEIVSVSEGIDVQISLVRAQRAAFQIRRRHMAVPVGCGLCGVESIEAAMRPFPRFCGDFFIEAQEIGEGMAALARCQPLNDATRCAHAAGFYLPGKGLVAVREDIGRHNALDKLIGALARAEQDCSKGIIIVTSRLSVEMVQKAAIAGVPLIAAISASTAKAVEIAGKAHITLVARVRQEGFEIMTCPERII